ncbi:hypothetical protein D3C81_1324890 [compost metagenome]
MVASAKRASSASFSAAWCSLRAGTVAKRGSRAHSSRPSAVQSVVNSASLPTAMTMKPSRVANMSNGVIDGCRVPSGFGTPPVAE